MINEFSKVAGYKINKEKSAIFLDTNNEISERESKKKIPFKITLKKLLGINLAMEEKDLYADNYKTLIKGIACDLKKWKYIPCSWSRRINIVKMTTVPKAICRFSAILSNLP